MDDKFETISKDRAKTKSSHRTLPLVPHFKKVLLDLKKKQKFYREVCGNCYSQKYLDYVYVNELGNLIKPDYITSRFNYQPRLIFILTWIINLKYLQQMGIGVAFLKF